MPALRTTHSTKHNGETCECHLPVYPSLPTLPSKQSYTLPPCLSLLTVIESGLLLLYYSVLSCPVLFYVPPPTQTRTDTYTYVLGPVWFLAAGCTHQFEPDSRHRFSRSNVWAAAASPQLRCAALHCTALHWHHRLGLDWMAALGLAAERARSKAVELLRCAPGLPVPLLPLDSDQFKFLLTGSPRQFQPAFPPLLPRLDSVISLFLSSLST